MRQTLTFEATYPRYPFAPLVSLGIALARLMVRARDGRAAGSARPGNRVARAG
ncbi:MAG: hypothetical protein ACE5GS_11340 [Kiloniellaceae bacterium]